LDVLGGVVRQAEAFEQAELVGFVDAGSRFLDIGLAVRRVDVKDVDLYVVLSSVLSPKGPGGVEK
jgi:hypothetical protein